MKFRALILTLSLAASASGQLRAPKGAAKPTPPKPAPAAPAVPAKPAKPIPELDTTAVGALKLLPKEMARRVARIEAREGHPWPERWYVLVFDPAAPHGLREYVFSEGKMITSRTLSQFADSFTKEDAVGAEAVRINNDTAVGTAAQFAIANGKRLGSIDYELRKAAPGVAVWRLTCTDAGGQPMGVVELHAGKGTVVAYEGFEKSPVAVQALPPVKATLAVGKKGAKPVEKTPPPKTVAPAAKPENPATVEKPAAPKPVAEVPAEPKPEAVASVASVASGGVKNAGADAMDEKPVADKPVGAPAPKTAAGSKKTAPVPPPAEAPKAVPIARTVAEPPPAPGAVKRIGNSVKRLFGRDE